MVKTLQDKLMRNEFIHKEYDPGLKTYMSQLFMSHIFSLENPNLLDEEDQDGQMNIMDYLFKKLSKKELMNIESKEAMPVQRQNPIDIQPKSVKSVPRKRKSLIPKK